MGVCDCCVSLVPYLVASLRPANAAMSLACTAEMSAVAPGYSALAALAGRRGGWQVAVGGEEALRTDIWLEKGVARANTWNRWAVDTKSSFGEA